MLFELQKRIKTTCFAPRGLKGHLRDKSEAEEELTFNF